MSKEMNKKIVVCIPGYNVARSIRELVTECRNYSEDVIVCDDGSSDDTASEAMIGGATVISHSKNCGKGVALKSLFNIAKYLKADVTITIDGDGQFLPQEISKIAKPVLEGNADIVIGYRFGGDNTMPTYRKIGNKLLDKMSNMASELNIRDTQSGFRAYSLKAINLIDFQSERFGVDSEILIDASRKGLKMIEEKVTVLYNTGEQTSTTNPISQTSQIMNSLIELIALRRPLRYLGIPGFGLMIVGIVFSVTTISIFNHDRYFSIPMTLISLGCFIVGIMLILMSVVLFSIGKAIRKGYS